MERRTPTGAFVKPKIALFRALEDAEKSAEELAARGFEALLAPVIEFQATGAPIPEEGFDVLAATSA